MATYPSLKGKRVLVTGGATGIGEHIVRGFCAQGASVVFLDIDAPSGTALAAELGAQFVLCDLTLTAEFTALIAAQIAQAGAFDTLVNNAARDDRHAIREVTPEYWDRNVQVNLKHYFFAAQAVIEGMKAKGGGSIVNMGSITSYVGAPDIPVYASVKGACVSMTRTLAKALGADNIRVNAVIPGWVKTQRQIDKWITPEAEAAQMKKQVLQQWIEPQDLANMVVFLASDEAKMCTAQVYVVDAGWM